MLQKMGWKEGMMNQNGMSLCSIVTLHAGEGLGPNGKAAEGIMPIAIEVTATARFGHDHKGLRCHLFGCMCENVDVDVCI